MFDGPAQGASRRGLGLGSAARRTAVLLLLGGGHPSGDKVSEEYTARYIERHGMSLKRYCVLFLDKVLLEFELGDMRFLLINKAMKFSKHFTYV